MTPVVKELWEAMKAKVWEVLKGEELALAGDGRNDSPGHSATCKYCVYTLMEHYLPVHLIVDIEVVDKRETGHSSATMEKLALKHLIERAMTDLKIVDLVTDASSMTIALIRTLKEVCKRRGWQHSMTLSKFYSIVREIRFNVSLSFLDNLDSILLHYLHLKRKMASFNYARSKLLLLGRVCLADNVLNRLPGSTFTIIKSLGLLRAGRGCRAGTSFRGK